MADQNATDGDTLPVGNKLYGEMLIREGKLGVRFTRDRASDPYAWAEIVPGVFRRSVLATTAGVLRRLAPEAGTDGKIDSAASSITEAVCVVAFLKVRSVNLMVGGHDEPYIVKPRVPEPFEIPLPFAAAVSRLGAVEAGSLTRRMVAVPAIPADAAASWLLKPGRAWGPHACARATAFARSLGSSRAPRLAPRGGRSGEWWRTAGSPCGASCLRATTTRKTRSYIPCSAQMNSLSSSPRSSSSTVSRKETMDQCCITHMRVSM